MLAPSFEGLSAIALAMKSPERGARLLGAAEELRPSMGVPPVVWERNISENTIHALRTILEADALETLRAEGRAMTIKQAIFYCLEVAGLQAPVDDAAQLESD